ncbi:sensor histidine kinase [Campylobacter geochelonis]|uniref:histidine kinase n=1 Tax=Campylobacter geochelonis TaxID=1780362 RepID=A0A128EL72_9BACT|nr:HAMP domain-containing sensor histidine kinase [Campylobacter geochelonis]QKF71291.1 two-component system sensor histidine kinase [Campylobacter geochelonis]CZE48111.1 PAS/PAC sensor signal transduction histidine kinase [Campylobacter geochelonis]CZE48993.1 PAS/PAC sensor signal transduction histidine kinase [Campylobacter geochelonis]CZE51090.1 PAS/PAC sensor signal transduction histidine kinase [Campylobacter geochelonis]
MKKIYKVLEKFTNLTLRQKNFVFIAFLISLLLLILYFVISSAHKGYIFQSQKDYEVTLDGFYENYTSNLAKFYSALSFEGIDDEFLAQIKSKNTNSLLYKINKSYNNIKSNDENLIKIELFLVKDSILVEQKSVKFVNFAQTSPALSNINFSKRSFVEVVKYGGELAHVINIAVYDKHEIVAVLRYFISYEKLVVSIYKFDKTIVEFKQNKQLNSTNFPAQTRVLKDGFGNPLSKVWFYHDIEKSISSYNETMKNYIYISVVLFVLTVLMVNFIFTYLTSKLEKSEAKLLVLNKNLAKEVKIQSEAKFEILKKSMKEAKEKEQMMLHQARLATIGEMIANIAHQWRQPLTALGAIFIYLDMFFEKNDLKNEKISQKISSANSLLSFMSNTIDDFRNFYKTNKTKEIFFLSEVINQAIGIFSGSLKNYAISLKLDINDSKIYAFKNELAHVIVNLISNSKDAFLEKDIKDRTIMIKTYIILDEIHLEIIDNAGGIDESILSKIFEPYFSTKDKKFGTGMGLYISKIIVENSINGKILATNIKNGMKFEIILKNGLQKDENV